MTCAAASKSLADQATAWAPVLISLAVAYIAWAQYATNRAKLKLDLYGRRFTVYEKTLNYYLRYMRNGEAGDSIEDSQIDFVRAYRESMFLFGAQSKVYETLTEIKDVMAFNVQYAARLQAQPSDKDANAAWSQTSARQPDVGVMLLRLEIEMLPYLDFKQIERAGRGDA